MTTMQITQDTTSIKKAAQVIRALSIDSIEAANSGHPGLPLGCAEIGACLYSDLLKHYPKEPDWICRDRFILSAGHGSMLLYACLHLAGFDISMEAIRKFRQIDSPCAGHPEYKHIPGVETTTGPLGQGFAMSVGVALSQLMIKDRFDVDRQGLFDAQTICLVGDGDLMEGVASEAASLAGHLSCHNLTVIYDANNICLDGEISECFTENVKLRFEAYGWQVENIDGHNIDQILKSVSDAKVQSKKPTLIIAKTTIGYGSPNRQGSSESHGKALGDEESRLTKENLGIDWQAFEVPKDVSAYFDSLVAKQKTVFDSWQQDFENWQFKHPDLAKELDDNFQQVSLRKAVTALDSFEISANKASRQQSGELLQKIAELCSNFVGGSADLSCSDNTFLKNRGIVTAQNYNAQNFKFGVREFAMAAIINGLALGAYFKPFCGTFLVFSDYMRNAIRLAALMNLPVVYQFTHDSVFLGEDGPTHQPIEHLASLRAIPNLTVLRPADELEVKGAWQIALQSQGPVAIILSRQKLLSTGLTSSKAVEKGAYIVKESHQETVDYLFLSSGSELSLALEVQSALEKESISSRVISFVSWEQFDKQDSEYQKKILDRAKHTVVIEAQSRFAWERYAGRNALFITVDDFGKSAPIEDLQTLYGFKVDGILNKIKRYFKADDSM